MPFGQMARADGRDSGAARHANWYRLYYVLAALDIATVLVCLLFNHMIMQIYTDSVTLSQRWEKRQQEYAALSRLAHAVNAPGNDVFESRDVRGESARMHMALLQFSRRFQALRAEAAQYMEADQGFRITQDLDTINETMRGMAHEGEMIFLHLENGEADHAGQRMAAMDRKFASVDAAFAGLFASVRRILHSHFERQLAAADVIKQLEYLITGLALLMIVGALYYGSRLYRAAKGAEAERAAHLAAVTRARAEAHAANEAKSKFLAVMSHEIRTPLNAMFLALDTLENPCDRDEAHQHIALARSSGRSLQRLIDGLLDLSKIDAGKLEFEVVAFDLRRLLHELLAPHVRQAQAKGVALAVRVAPEVPPALRGDPLRFGQLVANLVDNAVKFTDAGSIDVAVSLRTHDDANVVPLRVTVCDTGKGVKLEQQGRIFDDFVQGDESTTRRNGGAGLGLAIVRRLVELMRGRVGVTATPGGGATFWFEIDLEAGPREMLPAAPLSRAVRQRAFAGRRVLVVEDAPASRTLAAAVLGQLGLNVDVAADGFEAVAAAAAVPYDAIFMDIALPGMDGLQATRLIRSREKDGAEVPIIGLTARVLDGTVEECLDVGMDDCIAKPASRESLLAALQRWIEP